MKSLADELQALSMAYDPFRASESGSAEFDDAVPDLSVHAAERYVTRLEGLRAEASEQEAVTSAEALTLSCVRHVAASEIGYVGAGLAEHNLSPMEGLGRLISVSAQASPASSASLAAVQLERLHGYARYLEGLGQRLLDGASRRRRPVAGLRDLVVAQMSRYLLSAKHTDPLRPRPDPSWRGSASWMEQCEEILRDEVRPAVARHRELLLSLQVRGDARPGLLTLPGGDDDYSNLVRAHTTLALSPSDLHAQGVSAVAEVREDFLRLADALGLRCFDEAAEAVVMATRRADIGQLRQATASTMTRAEAALHTQFDPPLPPTCAVEPMSEHLAKAGAPPHYTAPSDDGKRPGTYHFNPVGRMGAGWDLEATAFHEGVPGHHFQTCRARAADNLPSLQTQGPPVTAYSEGWALYAEELAAEMDLYSCDEQRLGRLALALLRSARLVVDTGIHALGWTRREADAYMRANVPVSEDIRVSEVNRYIATPGQALAYWVGRTELMRLRKASQAARLQAFDIRRFHAAVLDHGRLPLPSLELAVAGLGEQHFSAALPTKVRQVR